MAMINLPISLYCNKSVLHMAILSSMNVENILTVIVISCMINFRRGLFHHHMLPLLLSLQMCLQSYYVVLPILN